MDIRIAFIFLAMGLTVITARTSSGTVGLATVTLEPVSCHLDDDRTNPMLEQCLGELKNFMKLYLKQLKKPHKKKHNICSKFEEVHSCIKPLLLHCPAIKKELEEKWGPVIRMFSCRCNQSNPGLSLECTDKLVCFRHHHVGMMAKRCHKMYKFNVQQKTKPRCFFLAEKLHCQQALVSSACGSDVGDFAFTILKYEHKKHIHKHRCIVEFNTDYSGFRYDSQCLANLTDTLHECESTYIWDSRRDRLEFYKSNDLVAEGEKKHIKKSCRKFKEYKKCVRPVKESCSTGFAAVYQYEKDSRTYAMKMDYICDKKRKTAYVNSLDCYQDLVYNNSLTPCLSIWRDEAHKLLEKANPVKFFCNENHPDVTKLKKSLRRLRDCYEDIFTAGCGRDSGQLMGGLIAKAFKDPYYLRYKFQPDCSLHGMLGTTTPQTLRLTTPPVVNRQERNGASVGGKPKSSRNSSAILCRPNIFLIFNQTLLAIIMYIICKFGS